jgi:tetratricopeptide (TPR) repeat protein
MRAASIGQPAESNVLPVLARVQQSLARIEDAERTWRRLRAIEPRNAAALRFYEDYHEAREDWGKLFTTLQFALSVVEDADEKVRVNKKMARVAEARLNNLERAVEAYKRVLSVVPGDAEAEEALVALYEKTRKWHALVEFYNERLRRLPPEATDDRVATLFRIIDVYQDAEKLPGEDNVLATYARIVEVSPTNEQALETLAKGYQSRERWPDLLKVLQKKVLVTQDPVELLDLFHQIAEIAITRMSNETQAIPFLERILELDPQNLEVVQRLKGIYQRKHNQEKLYAMHLRELKMLAGPERETVLAQAATMARDRLLRFEDALKLYEELYLLNPNLREARENLHQLFTRLERWSDYARFLAEEVRRPMPLKRRVELLHKLGEVQQDRLGDVAAARRTFETVLAEDPRDDLAARRLEQIYLDQEDLKALHAVFARRGDLRSYVALLAQREAKEEDLHRRVVLNLAMAQSCEVDLNEPARALRFLEKAFATDHGLVEVGQRLLGSYEASGDVEKTAAVLKELAPGLSETADRRDAWLKLHRAQTRLGQHAEALAAGREALRLAMIEGEPTAILDALRETAAAGSLWQEFAEVLEEVAAATMDAEWRIALLLELGGVYQGRMLFHEEARGVLERVLDLDPGNTRAMDILEDIALQLEDYVALEGVLRRRIDVARDETEIRDIRMRLGRLYEDLLGDDGAAAECYMLVVQSAGDDREALAGLHRTYERSEKFVDLADVIRMEIAAATNDRERLRLQCELAQTCWEHLEDYDEAMSLLGAVLRADASSVEAHRQLRTLFDRRLARDAAANLLAPFYRRNERFDDLLYLLSQRLEDLARPEARSAVLMEVADILDRVKGEPEAAFEKVAQGVALHPTEAWVERLISLADATGRHADAAVAVGRWVGIVPPGVEVAPASIPDASREARLALLLGRLYADRLRMPALAIKAFEKSLPFEEQDEPLLRKLLALYREVADVTAVLRTYDRLADSVRDPGGRRQVLVEKAAYARAEGRPEAAAETLRVLLDMTDRDYEVAAELEDVLSSLGRWDGVLGVLERRERWAASASERAEVLYQLAAVCRDQLGRNDRAAEYARRALHEEPARPELRAAAKQLALDENLPGYAEYAPALLSALEEVLRPDTSAVDDLVAVVRARARFAATPWDRVVALTDVAGIEKARGRLDEAFAALRDAFQSTPDDQSLLERLVEAGEAAGQIDALVEALESAAPRAGIDARVRILLRVADLCRTRLSDNVRAMTIYDQLLEIQPGALAVMREMDSLLHEMGREAERIPLLHEMAVNAPSVEEKRGIFLTIGELCHATGDFEGAIRSYEYVLERRVVEEFLDPPAVEAARRLLGIAELMGRVKQVVDLHLLVGRTATDAQLARRELVAAAGKTRDELKEPREALGIFREVLAREPGDAEARDWAKACSREIGDAATLRELIRAQVELAAGDEARVDALMELAELQLQEDGPDWAALETLKSILALAPAHAPAREALSTLLQVDALAAEAAVVLEDAARRAEDDEALLVALAVQADRATDGAERARIRLRLGPRLASMGRIDESLRVLREAHGDVPADGEVFEELVRVLSEAGRLEELAEATARAVEGAHGSAERLQVRTRAALALIRGGHAGLALPLLEANADEEPSHRATLDLIVEVAGDLGRHDAVLRALDRMAEFEKDDGARIVLLLKAAGVADGGLKDETRVEAYHRKVLDIEPLHDTSLAAVTRILETRQDAEGLAAIRRHELARIEGRKGVANVRRAAELRRLLAIDALDRADQAAAVERAMELAGARKPSAEDLVTARRVWTESGFPPALYHELSQALEKTGDREGLLDLRRFAASMDLPDPPRAETLRQTIELSEDLGHDAALMEDLVALTAIGPEDGAVRTRLEAVGRRLGRVEEVKDALVAAFGRHQDEPVAYDLAVTIGRLLRDDLARDDEAADYLRVAFLRRPSEAGTSEALGALYLKLSRFGDLALLYETLGDLEEEGNARVALYFKAYEVVRHKVNDPIGASEVLKKVLDQDPSNRTALDEYEAIARETNDAQSLAHTLARKAETAVSQTERRAVRLELARVQSEALADATSAIATLNELVENDPTFEEAYGMLEGLLAGAGRYPDLALLYEREAEVLPGSDTKVAALKKAAAVHEAKLGDRLAATNLLQRILEIEPLNQFAFVRLESMLREAGDHASVVELLTTRLGLVHASSEQVALHARIGRVLVDAIGDNLGAVEHFKAALALDPYCEDARIGLETLVARSEVAMDAVLALEGLYDATGQHMKLCDALRHELDLVATPGERENILLRIAEIQVERLADSTGAMGTFGEALAANPANVDTLEHLENAAAATGRWEVLYRLLDDVTAAARSPDVAARLHQKAATIADGRMHALAEAARHYDAFLTVNPGDVATLARLEKLYAELRRNEDIARVLRQRIGLGGEAAEPDLRIRLAVLLAGELSDADGAVEQLRAALAMRPGDSEAIRHLSALSEHPVAGRHALEVMTTAFREGGDDAGRLWALEQQIARAADPADTLTFHDEAAAVARRLGRAPAEMEHLGRALVQSPSEESLMARLMAAAREYGLEADAVKHLRAAADVASWPELEKSLRLQAARIGIRSGAWTDDLETCLRRILEIDPMNREAVEALEKRYADTGRPADLVEVLDAKLKLDLGHAERVATLLKVAEVREMRRERDRAVAALEEVAALEPSGIDALSRLEALYKDIGNVAGRVATMERIAAAAGDLKESTRILIEASKLQSEELHDAAAARGTLENVLAIDPEDVTARRMLLGLYEDLGDWRTMLKLLSEDVENARTTEERVAAATRAAAVAETNLEDLTAAISMMTRASEIDPQSGVVADELVRLNFRADDAAGLIGALRKKAALAGRNEKVAILAKACEVALTQVGDIAAAGTIAQEIVALDATNPRALLVMARMMESRDQLQDALGLYRRLASAEGQTDERVDALLGIARIRFGMGDRGEETREALKEAAKLRPQHAEVNKLLRKVLHGSGEIHAVIDVMLRELKQAADDVERASISMDIADLYLKEMNDGAKFLQWAEEAHRAKRDDPRVVAGIVNFHLQSGEERRAAPYLEWLVSYLEGKRRLKELPPYAYELGRILEGMGQPEKAVQYYRLCHEHDATNIPNALALGRLYLRREEHEKALRVYQPLILKMDTLAQSARIEVLLAIARINLARGDRKKARQYVLRVLSEEPDNSEAQGMLGKGL